MKAGIAINLVFVVLSSDLAYGGELQDGNENCSSYMTPDTTVPTVEFLTCLFRRDGALQEREAERRRIEADERYKMLYKNSPSHSSWSYQRCVIKNLPDAQNDYSAQVMNQDCLQFPYYAKETDSDYFGYSTAAECFRDTAKKTPSRIAAVNIRRACDDLFPQ